LAGQPSDTAAGMTINGTTGVIVDVVDTSGNLVTTDTSTVTLTLNQNMFDTGFNTVSVAASGGVATFSGLVIDTAAGGSTLPATDTGLTSTVSNTFAINPAAASQLVFTQQPTNPSTAGVTISPAVVVQEEDAFGNVETGDSTTTVTLTLNQ